MPDINFQDIFTELKDGVLSLAKSTVTQFAAEANADGQAFLESSKANLEDWTSQLVNESISKDDFTDLVAGQKDLFELTALKQAGLAEIAIDNFKTGVINLISQTVFSFL